MNTVVAIIVVIFAIVFRQRLMTGIVGGLIFAFFGSLFGGSGGKIGFVIGFIIGLCADENSENNQAGDNKEEERSKNAGSRQSANSNDTQIVRCPSCTKKIRLRLPLQGSRAICQACSNYFHIRIDVHGNIRVEKEKSDNHSGANQGNASVYDYFRILEVESTATPNEIRAAYKRKIREYHPDRVSGLGKKFRELAEEESKAINSAYSVLKEKGLAA